MSIAVSLADPSEAEEAATGAAAAKRPDSLVPVCVTRARAVGGGEGSARQTLAARFDEESSRRRGRVNLTRTDTFRRVSACFGLSAEVESSHENPIDPTFLRNAYSPWPNRRRDVAGRRPPFANGLSYGMLW